MPDPSHPLDAEAMLPFLAAQQRRILGIVDGLDDGSLRRPVLPSGWSCAGMVRHLTITTRFWFVEVMGGHPVDSPEADDFHVPGDRPATALLDDFREQAETSMAVVRDLPLHTQPAWWPEGAWGGWRLDNLHEVILHLLVETACHAGHLDAARELIDKRTWDYPSGRLSAPSPIPAS